MKLRHHPIKAVEHGASEAGHKVEAAADKELTGLLRHLDTDSKKAAACGAAVGVLGAGSYVFGAFRPKMHPALFAFVLGELYFVAALAAFFALDYAIMAIKGRRAALRADNAKNVAQGK